MRRVALSRELTIAVVASLGLHVLWLASEAKASRSAQPQPAEVLLETFELPPPVPTEPAPTPLPEEKTPEREPEVAKAIKASSAAQAAAPPVAAQAAQTLTAPDDGKADLLDFTLVQGTGTQYAGGTTSSLGTSTTAVRGPASARPVAGAAPAAVNTPASVGPDLSRSPVPLASDWDCSQLFPSDPEAGDRATVTIAVTVLADGSAQRVAILRDPGHGFAAAARTCAMGQRFRPALDRAGKPVISTTPPITVRFTR